MSESKNCFLINEEFLNIFKKLRFHIAKSNLTVAEGYRFETLIIYMKGAKFATISDNFVGEACGCSNPRGAELLKSFARHELIIITYEPDFNKKSNHLRRKVSLNFKL